MTRTELLTTLARRLNKNTTLDTATQNRLLDYLNEVQRTLVSMPGAGRLRQMAYSFSSAASRATYFFPGMQRLDRIVDTTNDRVLREITRDQYRALDPDPQTGTPECFVWDGIVPLTNQPADASAIYVKSSAAGDTTQTAYLEALTSGGVLTTVSATLTGTTAVAFSGTTYVQVTKFYLSAVGVGTITLHEDSGTGLQLASIPIGSTRPPQAAAVTLWRTPSATVTYVAEGQRQIADLAQATDAPLIPDDWQDLLVFGAMVREYEHMDDPRVMSARDHYQTRLRQFKYWLAETGTGEQDSQFERPSRLGAWVASGV